MLETPCISRLQGIWLRWKSTAILRKSSYAYERAKDLLLRDKGYFVPASRWGGRFLGSSTLIPLNSLSLVRRIAGLQVKQISPRVAQIPLELSPVESGNVVGRVEEALCPIRASPISCRLYPICTNRLCPSFGGSFLRQSLPFECERS